MKLELAFLVVCFFVCFHPGKANEQLMICKPVSSAFQAQQNSSETSSLDATCLSTVRAGKRGPPGIPVRF